MKKIVFLLAAFALFLSTVAQQTTPSNEQQTKKEKKPQKQQIGLGIKAGINFSNITNASQISAKSSTGFMVGAFFAPPSKGILGYRTEFIFSRQGYDYSTNSTTGSVKLNYLLLPQLMTINISRFFEIDFGFQMAFLLSGKADSSQSSSGNPYGKMLDYYNKFQYGFAGGVQINPVRIFYIGARYNISLNSMYKDQSGGTGMPIPGFIPDASSIDIKNNVLQVYAGFKF